MRWDTGISGLVTAAALAAVLLPGQCALAHGGVVAEGDACVISISYLKAHFKVYQPRSSGHEEFCEDLPEVTETVFVIEYLHDELGTLPLEFRIIENVTGKGRFARWEDVAAIGDIDSITEFHRRAVVEPYVYTAVHEFGEAGSYIGIVTAHKGDGQRRYVAVFPFDVGFTGFGPWPWLALAVILIQLQYLWMSGGMARWRARRRIHEPELELVQGGKDEN